MAYKYNPTWDDYLEWRKEQTDKFENGTLDLVSIHPLNFLEDSGAIIDEEYDGWNIRGDQIARFFKSIELYIEDARRGIS